MGTSESKPKREEEILSPYHLPKVWNDETGQTECYRMISGATYATMMSLNNLYPTHREEINACVEYLHHKSSVMKILPVNEFLKFPNLTATDYYVRVNTYDDLDRYFNLPKLRTPRIIVAGELDFSGNPEKFATVVYNILVKYLLNHEICLSPSWVIFKDGTRIEIIGEQDFLKVKPTVDGLDKLFSRDYFFLFDQNYGGLVGINGNLRKTTLYHQLFDLFVEQEIPISTIGIFGDMQNEALINDLLKRGKEDEAELMHFRKEERDGRIIGFICIAIMFALGIASFFGISGSVISVWSSSIIQEKGTCYRCPTEVGKKIEYRSTNLGYYLTCKNENSTVTIEHPGGDYINHSCLKLYTIFIPWTINTLIWIMIFICIFGCVLCLCFPKCKRYFDCNDGVNIP